MAGMSAKQRALQSAKFKKAWQTAKELANKYGGKAYQYFLAKGENVLKDEEEKTGEIIVDPKDLPFLPWSDWHLDYYTLYHELQKESKEAEDSPKSWQQKNISWDNYNIRMSNYRSWKSSKQISNKHVIAEIKDAWENINGKEVIYLDVVNYFVYKEAYELYKKAGYTTQEIINMKR